MTLAQGNDRILIMMQTTEREIKPLSVPDLQTIPDRPEVAAPQVDLGSLPPEPETSFTESLQTVHALDRLPYLVRLGSLHALLVPVIWGAALAWWQMGSLNLWTLLLSLLGAGSLYLGTHAFVAHADHRRTQQRGAKALPDFLITPEPTLIFMTDWGDILSVGWLLLIFGILATGWLTYLGGWPVLFFGGLSAGIALAYALPPLQFGYRTGAFGEIGPLIAFGYLPVLISFYVQSGTLTALALMAAVPVAMLVALIGLVYQLISWRQDWRLRKRTPVMALQPKTVLDLGAVMVGLAFAGILVLAGVGQLPIWALLGLAALPLALGPYARIHLRLSTYGESVALLQSTIATTATLGLLLSLALWLDKGF